MCNAVYLNPFATFKQCYTPYEKKCWNNNFQVEYCYFNQDKAQSINDVALPDIASNMLRGDHIGLDFISVCDYIYDEILDDIF